MKDCRQFYIDGKWVAPAAARDFPVTNPAAEEHIATISLGSVADVEKAVAAAKRAFEMYSETSVVERLALLRRIMEIYESRMEGMAAAISSEMGAPISLARAAQAPAGLRHLSEMVKVLAEFPFEKVKGSTLDAERASGSVRTYYALELADEPSGLQSGTRASGRLHNGSQAQRICAAICLLIRRDSRSSGRPAWCIQHGQRRWTYRGITR